jgi:chemotaxis response regulator CheB
MVSSVSRKILGGCTGLRVAQAGEPLASGTVIVQEEASAEYAGMPSAAILTGVADQILPLDGIAPALVELTGRPR